MTDAQRIKSAAAARGMPMKEVASRVGAHPAALSRIISGSAPYPKAAEYLAKTKALLGITDPEPIPYDSKLVKSSTGLPLPVELHNFLRHLADKGEAPSISAIVLRAVEDKYRLEITDFIRANPKRATYAPNAHRSGTAA